jgi:hypothetical protein
MVELVEEEYERFRDDAELQAEYASKKAALTERKNKIFDIIDHEPELVQKVSAIFSNVELVAQLRAASNFHLEYLSTHHGVTTAALEAYAKFAKVKYECGMYSEAEEMLNHYLSVATPPSASATGSQSTFQGALWGKLACRLLQAKWEDSLNDLHAVKDSIEVRNVNPSDQLRQRACCLCTSTSTTAWRLWWTSFRSDTTCKHWRTCVPGC